MEVLIRVWKNNTYVLEAGFSEIDKHGASASNEAFRLENFQKKNKMCCTLIREVRVST